MKKSNADERVFHEQVIKGVRSMWSTFYWIDEALGRHLQEFKARPDVVAALAECESRPIDVIARLERLREEAERLSIDLTGGGHCFLLQCTSTRFEDLSTDEVAGLSLLNEQLDGVAKYAHTVAKRIEEAVRIPCADPADRMFDYEIDAEVHFDLRDDDAGYREDGDNTLAEIDDCLRRAGEQWPDGYEQSFPIPHGSLLHELRLYGGYARTEVDYRDMLRIGYVWTDIVVHYQYCYDVVQRRWIKRFEREAGNGTVKTVYVSEPGE